MRRTYDIAKLTADFLRSQRDAAVRDFIADWDAAIQAAEAGALTTGLPPRLPDEDVRPDQLTSEKVDLVPYRNDDGAEEPEVVHPPPVFSARTREAVSKRKRLVLDIIRRHGGEASRGEIVAEVEPLGVRPRQVEHILRKLRQEKSVRLVAQDDPRENRWQLVARLPVLPRPNGEGYGSRAHLATGQERLL